LVQILHEWVDIFQIEIPDSEFIGAFSPGETFVATLSAFVIGYLVIAWLMKYVQTKSLCFLLSIASLLGFSY
jgi:undecaprenyl pyrophosphate phosphatase UppP